MTFQQHDVDDFLTVSKICAPENARHPPIAVAKTPLQIRANQDSNKAQTDVRLRPELQMNTEIGKLMTVKSISRLDTGLPEDIFETNSLSLQIQQSGHHTLTSTEVAERLQTSTNRHIIQNIQAQRKYKFGLTTKHKHAILENTMKKSSSAAAYQQYNEQLSNSGIILHSDLGANVNIVSRHRTASQQSVMTDSIDFPTLQENTPSTTDAKLSSILPAVSTKPKKEPTERRIVVRPMSSTSKLDSYQLTTLPAMTQDSQTASEKSIFMTKSTNDDYNVLEMGAPQPPRPSTAPVKNSTNSVRVPMYNPATFRLPSKEVVLGFGGEPVELAIPLEEVTPCHHPPHHSSSSGINESPEKKIIRSKSAVISQKEKTHHAVAILPAEIPQSVADASAPVSVHQTDIDHDGYLTDRKEVFLQESLRAESIHNSTAHSRPVTANINSAKQNGKGILSRNRSAASTRVTHGVDKTKTVSIDFHHTDRPRPGSAVEHFTHGSSNHDSSGHVQQRPHPQSANTLRCKECFKTAVLWCQECDHAYCGICWPKITHHTAVELTTSLKPSPSMVHNFKKPPRLPLPEASQPVRSYVRSSSPVQPGNSTRLPGSPNSYSSAVLLGVYEDKDSHQGDGRITALQSPVKVPRPDSLVTQYRDYPMPPIFLDGKGHVLETVDGPEVDSPFDSTGRDFLGRPQSSRQRCQSPLNRSPSNQSNKYNNGIPITSNSSFARSSSRRRVKGDLHEASLASNDDPSKFQMNTIHYVSKHKIGTLNPLFAAAASESNSLDFVRTNTKALTVYNDDLDFGRVRVTPAFSAGQGSTLGFAYSSRQSADARPLTGITRDFMPVEWQQQFDDVKNDTDKGISTEMSGANIGRRVPTPSDRTRPSRGQSAKQSRALVSPMDMNNRVLELYRGVGVYTKNNKELEARQASLRILEAGIKDVNTNNLSTTKGSLFNALPTETRAMTSSSIANKKHVVLNQSVGAATALDSGSLQQTYLQTNKQPTKLSPSHNNRTDNSHSKK